MLCRIVSLLFCVFVISLVNSQNITTELCGMSTSIPNFANVTNIAPNSDIDTGIARGTLTSACGNVVPNIVLNDDRIIFVPPQVFQLGQSCGVCLSVTALPSGNTQVFRITDQIDVNHVEISINQFNLLGGAEINSITWESVGCPDDIIGGGRIAYSFLDGSTVTGASIVFYASTPVNQATLVRNGTVLNLVESKGAWHVPVGKQQLPFNVTVSSITGEEATISIPNILSDSHTLVFTNLRFEPGCAPFAFGEIPATVAPTAFPPTNAPTTRAPTKAPAVKSQGGVASATYMLALYVLLFVTYF